MRIRNLFVASLLTMTFGCPGDDSGDTDAATTTATTTETPGTTTETPGTTTETPGTTTETPGTTTDAPGTSSGEPPADSGSSGDSTTGGAGLDCATFCTDFLAACGEGAANDYGDQAGCEAACAGYDQATYDCKVYHASMADGPDSVHCSHANMDGGGVC